MKHAKHTPGPWINLSNLIVYDSDDGGPFRSICQMNENNNEANARLVAAAPELLDALDQLVDLMWFGSREELEEIEKYARAVLAKSRGES
jgi:hypothetical protein